MHIVRSLDRLEGSRDKQSVRAHLYYGIPGKFLLAVPAVKRGVSFILGSKKQCSNSVKKTVSVFL